MTLKEELEILRGEPIEVFDGISQTIPYIETSDAEKLCRHPLVSVHMITYNHEPFVWQAFERVVMQETDFEYELVIGEDCSTDRMRKIYFEYQKRYPEKIRVLWSEHNLWETKGNSKRTTSLCRGKYIAFCKGDEFGPDPKKLQKQVDYMESHPGCAGCFHERVKCGGVGESWKCESCRIHEPQATTHLPRMPSLLADWEMVS